MSNREDWLTVKVNEQEAELTRLRAKLAEMRGDLNAAIDALLLKDATSAQLQALSVIHAELAAAREDAEEAASVVRDCFGKEHGQGLRSLVISLIDERDAARTVISELLEAESKHALMPLGWEGRARAALRSSEEPAAKPLPLRHEFVDYNGACGRFMDFPRTICGQPESAHKPAAEEPRT